MSKRPSAAMIGAFVLGAIGLAVLSVVLFGSGRLFRETVPFVLSFSGSVNGLNVGAPVKFKGVEIGSVTDVRLTLGEGTAAPVTRIPVLIEIDQDKVESQGSRADLWDPAVVKALIDAGLRGQLNATLEEVSSAARSLRILADYLERNPSALVRGRDGG